jgi:hypothetical protein
MNIDELVPFTNGLSVTTGTDTLVCDRARITPVKDDAIDMAFSIAGTDFVPRLRLTRARVSSSTADSLARILRVVVREATTGYRRR